LRDFPKVAHISDDAALQDNGVDVQEDKILESLAEED
jgi:hypothetical protein